MRIVTYDDAVASHSADCIVMSHVKASLSSASYETTGSAFFVQW